MSKRSAEEEFLADFEATRPNKNLKPDYVKKHTLDSDEDDSDDDERYNILNENDIEGEEDGIPGMDGEVKLTPFNMKEELEEGHFDAEGHFQWNKDNDIKDNWLDNLDWVKLKKVDPKKTTDTDSDSDSDSKPGTAPKFDSIAAYRRIFELMKPKETIKKTLQRLGSTSARLSSAERWKMKKAGIIDPNVALVTELTELTNGILTEMGNMDIYEETYEQIQLKYVAKTTTGLSGAGKTTSTAVSADAGLDMYADDFDTKEKTIISAAPEDDVPAQVDSNAITWEFKWKPEDEQIHGPFSTQQMQQWVVEGYFNDGVLVKKCGTQTDFNTSKRIDFELYL